MNTFTRWSQIRANWEFYNQDFFNGKLREPYFSIEHRNGRVDGSLEYLFASPRKHVISVHRRCFAEDEWFMGVICHEMIHQYQREILNRTPNHDAVFLSIARKMERAYGLPIRTPHWEWLEED